MITDYKVVYSCFLPTLHQEVKDLIDKGWEPFGGLVIDDGCFFQPMIKREEKTSL